MNLTAAVLEAVADESGRDPLDLPPLHGSIDAAALERCVESAGPESRFRFDYYQYTVTVRGTGEISVTPADGGGVADVEFQSN